MAPSICAGATPACTSHAAWRRYCASMRSPMSASPGPLAFFAARSAKKAWRSAALSGVHTSSVTAWRSYATAASNGSRTDCATQSRQRSGAG
jgi:hypothetical protein